MLSNDMSEKILHAAVDDGYYARHDTVVLADIAKFAVCVAQGRQVFGGSVVSWGRSPTRNEEVGGHPNSLHQNDLAADITFHTGDACSRCFSFYEECGFGGYIRPGGNSLHVQFWVKGTGPRPEPSHKVEK